MIQQEGTSVQTTEAMVGTTSQITRPMHVEEIVAMAHANSTLKYHSYTGYRQQISFCVRYFWLNDALWMHANGNI
jgi:hypothetical protein